MVCPVELVNYSLIKIMKKYTLFIAVLFLTLSAKSQTVRALSGFEPSTDRPGYKYYDTLISLPRTTYKYLTGYGTFGSLIDTARAAFSGTSNRITITSGVIDIGSDVVTLTGTQSLSNKTLTSPILNTSSTVGYVWTATNTSGAGAWAAGGGGGGGDVTETGHQTLTNKRITIRYASTTSSATPTINTDSVDTYELTAQAADITSFTTNLSGTPTTDQILHIIIVGTAARAITWGSGFEASTVPLPTTTVLTNRLDVYFVYNTTNAKCRCGGVW